MHLYVYICVCMFVCREQYSWKCSVTTCNIIKEGESGRQFIYKHIKEFHYQENPPDPNSSSNLKCPVCDILSKSKAGLTRHIQCKHKDDNIQQSIKPVRTEPTPSTSQQTTHPTTNDGL
uniref:C2H2-type domain-containing protein n=1 Tax=Cacopsylla melanoneura TaxID=428564 RepID=A0A8D9B9M2_9HEMI